MWELRSVLLGSPKETWDVFLDRRPVRQSVPSYDEALDLVLRHRRYRPEHEVWKDGDRLDLSRVRRR